jgi:hypothetical protein
MNDEGESFDPKDVVEKSDMVRIFVNSGRLDVITERKLMLTKRRMRRRRKRLSQTINHGNNDEVRVRDGKPAPFGVGPIVETVSEYPDNEEGALAGNNYDPDVGIDARVDTHH